MVVDLVRFHILYQDGFDANQIHNKKAVETEFTSFSAAKKEAKSVFAKERKPLVVTQTNPRRRGVWHHTRLWLN